MPLTLTIEDGSIVSGANSYATLAQARAYNAQRGVTLPVDDDDAIACMTQALDFIESYEPRFKGERASPLLQSLSWPRSDVYVFGALVGYMNIPRRLVDAQNYLTGVAMTVDLQAVQDTRAITKEVIGPIETDYDTKTGATIRPLVPALDSLLAPLLIVGSGIIKSIRV